MKEIVLTEWNTSGLRTGEKLVHIGAHDTGMAIVQGAFHSARERLSAHGVRYAGQRRQPSRAVSAALGKSAPRGRDPYRIEEWRALAREVKGAADQRVVLSSESLSDADSTTILRLVQDLGGRLPLRVVVTLQPLASIMRSSWQNVVQNGVRTPYEAWLRKTLAKADQDHPTSTFWRRQRHDRLVERWAEAVGEENVTVVVADEANRGMVLRSFEDLVGLPEGFLVPEPSIDDKRSLTFGEIELVRNLNNEFEQLGLTGTAEGRSLRRRVVRQMKELQSEHGGSKTVTPAWALERCAELGAEIAANIACSNVQLIGNVASLGQLESAPDSEPEARVSVALASAVVLGSVRATNPELNGHNSHNGQGDDASPHTGKSTRRGLERGQVADARARDLVGVIIGRVRRRMHRALRRHT